MFPLSRYWNVLSFALMLEFLLEKLLVNKKSLALPFNLIKVILIILVIKKKVILIILIFKGFPDGDHQYFPGQSFLFNIEAFYLH